MYFIGVTGGVGAGKSFVLSCLREIENSRVLLADDLAKELMEPGRACYNALRKAFAEEDILDEKGILDRDKMARVIFSDDAKRRQANAIIHPIVKDEILKQVNAARDEGDVDYFFLEAALLIEEHYDRICDELWYIYASEETRRERLLRTRGYSDDKIQSIFNSQLKEEDFRRSCQRIIDNGGKRRTTREQVQSCVMRLADREKAV